MQSLVLRKANESEVPAIWLILQQAIEQRRLDGSQQWQDGYPNEQVVGNDIANGYAYVLAEGEVIVAYAAIIFGIEPAYEVIEGKWLTDGAYVVVHRVAVSNAAKGKGVSIRFFEGLEDLCRQKDIHSIKLDTNFDNAPMLHIVAKLGYVYCGEIYYAGAARMAFEKVLMPI